jgi:hypothetical protein
MSAPPFSAARPITVCGRCASESDYNGRGAFLTNLNGGSSCAGEPKDLASW